MPDDFASLIEALTEPVAAAILGVPESHVRTMKARNSISPDYWPALVDAAPGHGLAGITHSSLLELRQRSRRRKAALPASRNAGKEIGSPEAAQ